MALIAPIPSGSPIVQMGADGKPLSGFQLNSDYYLWLAQLTALVQSSGKLLGTPIQLTGQGAAIGVTVIPLPALNAGIYRVSFYARVTTVAGVSSTLGAFGVNWTESGIAQSASAAGVTGNLNTTILQGQTPIQVDAATALSYTMGYASNPAGAMKYRLTVLVENIA